MFWNRTAAAVLSPLVGGVAPAVWLWLRAGARFDESAISGVCVWAIRDLLISYVIALPVLLLCRRIGVRRAVSLWLVAALVGYPMGYVLANPVEYAWTPTEADFAHGPYRDVMFTYTALFGLTGLLYAFGREGQPEWRPTGSQPGDSP